MQVNGSRSPGARYTAHINPAFIASVEVFYNESGWPRFGGNTTTDEEKHTVKDAIIYLAGIESGYGGIQISGDEYTRLLPWFEQLPWWNERVPFKL